MNKLIGPRSEATINIEKCLNCQNEMYLKRIVKSEYLEGIKKYPPQIMTKKRF